jgi:putative addiction module component (TIGR02574 family)
MSQQLPEAAAELLRTPLSVQQRLELIGELWDSIPDSMDALPIPEWHREELDPRLAAAEADPEAAIPWEEVRSDCVKSHDLGSAFSSRSRGPTCSRHVIGMSGNSLD